MGERGSERVSIGTAAMTEGNTIIGAVWGPSDWGIHPATFSINPEKQLEWEKPAV